MFYDTSVPYPQAECYTTRYNNPYTKVIPDTPAAALIVPEIYVTDLFLYKYDKFKKFILWESVNFYLTTIPSSFLNVFPLDTIHLTQSQYAYEYLLFAKVPKENILFIPDYISEEYIKLKNVTLFPIKENLITVLKAKSNKFTNSLLQKLKEKYNYKYNLLSGYTTSELINILQRSKVFLDFGDFPGKNRMYREASTCRNIILTSTFGAAKYQEDVNIPEEYKINLLESNAFEKAEKLVVDSIENFDKRIGLFNKHREESFKEKEIFDEKIKDLVKILRIGK